MEGVREKEGVGYYEASQRMQNRAGTLQVSLQPWPHTHPRQHLGAKPELWLTPAVRAVRRVPGPSRRFSRAQQGFHRNIRICGPPAPPRTDTHCLLSFLGIPCALPLASVWNSSRSEEILPLRSCSALPPPRPPGATRTTSGVPSATTGRADLDGNGSKS